MALKPTFSDLPKVLISVLPRPLPRFKNFIYYPHSLVGRIGYLKCQFILLHGEILLDLSLLVRIDRS